MKHKSKGIHWNKAENPRLRHLASLQQNRYPENLENGLIAVEFNDIHQNIQLRLVNEDVKDTFRRGSCTLLAYSLHEITGLPLVMFNHPRAENGGGWEGHAGVQVKPGVILEIGGVLNEKKMLKEFDTEYGVRLNRTAHIVTDDEFLKTILGFLGATHPSIETTELEWLVVDDFAKHLIRRHLIPYYKKNHPELVSDMEDRLAAKEASEAKEPWTETFPPLEESLRIYSKSAGIPWWNSPNTRLKELKRKDFENRYAGLPENYVHAFKDMDRGKITVRFRYCYDLMLDRIDSSALHVMGYEANSMLALALRDYLGLDIVAGGYWAKNKNFVTGEEKSLWIGHFGAKTVDGKFLDIHGLSSMESVRKDFRKEEEGIQNVNRDELIELATSGNKPENFPLNLIGELEWLVVQEYAKTLVRSVLLPHYRKHAPEAVPDIENRLQAWETTHPISVPEDSRQA